MKNWIKIFVYVVVAAIISVMSVVISGQKKRIVFQDERIKEQSTIIDSLLNRRMTVFDVKLNVTDKSTNKIGKNNAGNVTIERIYKLEIDSVNVGLK